MYDYHLVFIYPFQPLDEDLDGVEESVVNELEKSISKSVDDGWEYVSTTTYSKSKLGDKPSAQSGLKSFVYRRPSRGNDQFTDSEASALMKPVKKQAMKNETELASPVTPASTDNQKTVLLTMALLNAIRVHSQTDPDTLLPKFSQQGEITKKQEYALSALLKNELTPIQVAKSTPQGHGKEVFRVSLMPFGAEDSDYAEYIAELGVHLNLEDSFILHEVSQKHL